MHVTCVFYVVLYWYTFYAGSLSIDGVDEKLIEVASEGRMFCAFEVNVIFITNWHLWIEVDVFCSIWLFVRMFVTTMTSERFNIGWWNLAARCIVQKSCSSSNLGIIGPTQGPTPQNITFCWVIMQQ